MNEYLSECKLLGVKEGAVSLTRLLLHICKLLNEGEEETTYSAIATPRSTTHGVHVVFQIFCTK